MVVVQRFARWSRGGRARWSHNGGFVSSCKHLCSSFVRLFGGYVVVAQWFCGGDVVVARWFCGGRVMVAFCLANSSVHLLFVCAVVLWWSHSGSVVVSWFGILCEGVCFDVSPCDVSGQGSCLHISG